MTTESVTFAAGERLLVQFMGAGVTPFATAEPRGGATLFTFRQGHALTAERLERTPRGWRCAHVRFCRAWVPSDGPIHALGLRPAVGDWDGDARLRAACEHAEQQGSLTRVHGWGGVEHLILLRGETFVPAFSTSGTSGWILTPAQRAAVLAALPPLRDSGALSTIWVETVGYANTPDEWSARVSRVRPDAEDALTYWDRAAGYERRDNHHLFQVAVDRGSLRVTRIELEGEGPRPACVYDSTIGIRTLEVGRRVPRSMRGLVE